MGEFRHEPDQPRQLRTDADDDAPLTADEAAVAGITQPVYGDDSTNPNADDERDAHGST
jgi:hypothetical protein